MEQREAKETEEDFLYPTEKMMFRNIVAMVILTETEILMLGRCLHWDVLSFKTVKKLNVTDSHQCLKSFDIKTHTRVN